MLQETVQFYRWQNESLMFKCSIPKVLTNGSHNLSTKRLLGVKPAGKVTCSYMFQSLRESREWHTCPVKGQGVNILGFAGYTVVATIQLSHCIMTAAIDNR